MRRRNFLSGAAIGAAGGLLVQPAAALKLESMLAPLEAVYAQRCRVDPTHAALIQEAREKLATDTRVASERGSAALEDLAQELKQALTCPHCGCNLAVDGLPHPPAPRF
jgi:hypothetical protein